MKFFTSLLFFVVALLFSETSFALEQVQSLVRQPRTMAMGGAGVGLADDEYSLFHNPAGLAGLEERGFRPLGLGIEGSWDTYTNLGDIMALTSNFSIASLNVFMGKDIAFRASEVPMILLPHFALAYIVDMQFALNQYNLVNPNFNLGDMTTQGVQAGTAWSFTQGRHPTDEFRVGIAVKLLLRKGGYYDLGTAGLLQASGGGTKYLNSIVGTYGTGFGGDVGVQYLKKLSPTNTISIGSSLTDVANTKFSVSNAMTIPMNWSLGVGYKKTLDALQMSFALDMRNILQAMALSNKIHFGTELKLGVLDLYAGLNQLNPTYGFGFDVWVLKLMFLSYAEELGPAYHQASSRRAMMQVNFNMPI
jgi:hypothetical protein